MNHPLHHSQTYFFVSIDLEGRYTYFNEYYFKSFNQTDNIVLGNLCENTLTDHSRQAGLIALNRIVDRVSDREVVHLKKNYSDGKQGWSEWEFLAVFNANNELIGLNLMGHDIPDYLEKAATQAKYNTYLLETFADGSNAEISLKDENLRYLVCNQELANYFKIDKSAVYYKKDEHFYSAEVASQIFKTDKQAQSLPLGEVINCDVQVDGQFYRSQKFPVRLENGKIGVGCITLNITELVLNQKKIQDKELFITNLTNNVEGAIIQVHYTDDAVPSWEFASKGIEALTGLSFNDLQKDPLALRKMIPEQEFELVKAKIKKSIATLKPDFYQYSIAMPDGSLKWIELKASPKKQANNSFIINGFMSDITEKVKANNKILENETFLKNLTDRKSVV